ncbi:MAG: polysaccharide biosynthesis protein [Phycisphaerae bacterium]|nr:polysaccharide biosynthesis protein [Phycisphaerae bacterium]
MATTALLIGTVQTVRTLERQLALLPEPPVVLGCLLHDWPYGDPPRKHVRDIPILGSLDALEDSCERLRPSVALVSLPAPMHDLITALRTRLRRLAVKDRFFPTLEDQLAGVGPRTEFDVDLGTLIGRAPRELDEAAIDRVIRGKTVVVTGAGGSIGSELCRIIARFQPDRLVMVERSENALFEIDRQIARRWPGLRRHAALHDVVDALATKELFASIRPNVVFHAAAHKHVPMSEDHPASALDSNLFGTISAVDAAIVSGAERFVMVSTDKAVNPTSVMGMTKRLAEQYVQHVHAMHAQRKDGRAASRTTGASPTCSMVRFGNVLGSSGSVLETWKRQLADGGPITVTDPRMTRYFMTIPEAAALVIQAAALHDPTSETGEVFLLDMGEPIRIVDLATRFIRAHGLIPRGAEPGAPAIGDVAITYTGVRPGEKLFEELATDGEAVRPTRHSAIRVWGVPTPEPTKIAEMVHSLSAARRPREAQALVDLIRSFVPEAQPSAFTGLARVA